LKKKLAKKRVGSSYKTYLVHVFNDMLMYAAPAEGTAISKIFKSMGGNPVYACCKYAGKFDITDIDVENFADSPELFNACRIIVGRRKGAPEEVHTLIFPSCNDKDDFLKTVRATIDTLTTVRVFGVSLQDLMSKNLREKGRTIPRIVEITSHQLMERALKVQGIFRESGSASSINQYRAQLDIGGDVVFPSFEVEHNISGLLKLWIRCLPEPLLTFQLYDRWVQAGSLVIQEKAELQSQPLQRSLVAVRNLLAELPKENRYVMQVLMKLLDAVAANREANFMEPKNISIVFGPILLMKEGNPYQFESGDFTGIYALVSTFVSDYHALFDDIEKERLCIEKENEGKMNTIKP